MIDSKPLSIRFLKTDGIIRIYDGTRYLTLFESKEYQAIYDRIRYLIKSGITYIFSHYFEKIKNWFLWFVTYRKKIGFA